MAPAIGMQVTELSVQILVLSVDLADSGVAVCYGDHVRHIGALCEPNFQCSNYHLVLQRRL